MAETTVKRVVLIRAGASEGSEEKVLNGWFDADLTQRGFEEAEQAGQHIKDAGILFDESHTSTLQRANKFLSTVLGTIEQLDIPVTQTWKLNEQHYGELTGLNKEEYQKKFGEDFWKNEYEVAPPKITKENPTFSKILTGEEYPLAESSRNTVIRAISYWKEQIEPKLIEGKTLLVVAHENSLRGIIQHLEGLTPEETMNTNVPAGIPFEYELDSNLKPIVSRKYLAENVVEEAIETKLGKLVVDSSEEKSNLDDALKTEEKPKRGGIAAKATEMLDHIASLAGKDKLSRTPSKADKEEKGVMEAKLPQKPERNLKGDKAIPLTADKSQPKVNKVLKESQPKLLGLDKDLAVAPEKKPRLQPKTSLEKTLKVEKSLDKDLKVDKSQPDVSLQDLDKSQPKKDKDLKLNKSQPKLILEKDLKVTKSQPQVDALQIPKVAADEEIPDEVEPLIVEEKDNLLLDASKGKLPRSKKAKEVDIAKELEPLAGKNLDLTSPTAPLEDVEGKIPDEM